MSNSNRDKTRYYRYAAIVLAVVFVFSAALLAIEIWDRSRDNAPPVDSAVQYIEHDGKKYTINNDIETFLVLGLDKFDGVSEADSYNNDKQADFLMLLVIDDVNKTYSSIHINRDTMTNVNMLGVAGNKIGSAVKQIALAHTYGNGKDVSCRNTADSVSELLLGTKVDHYLSVTMDFVPEFNDLVGGVEVTVKDDFTGIDENLVKGQTVTLKGQQALTYVRTRFGLEDSSNSARMERQRQYLSALNKKTKQCASEDEEFIVKASMKIADYMVSDRSATQLQDIMQKLTDYEFSEICTINGESKVGEKFMEFYPDTDSIKETVIKLFCEPAD